MGTGFFAEIFAVIALFRLWGNPIPALWWVVVVLFILEMWFKSALKESLRLNGMDSGTSKGIAFFGMAIQIALIVIGISTFF
jgi:hypothetical protein